MGLSLPHTGQALPDSSGAGSSFPASFFNALARGDRTRSVPGSPPRLPGLLGGEDPHREPVVRFLLTSSASWRSIRSPSGLATPPDRSAMFRSQSESLPLRYRCLSFTPRKRRSRRLRSLPARRSGLASAPPGSLVREPLGTIYRMSPKPLRVKENRHPRGRFSSCFFLCEINNLAERDAEVPVDKTPEGDLVLIHRPASGSSPCR